MREKTSGVVVPRMNVNDDQAVISAWLVPVGEHVAEGQTKNVGTEVVEIRHSSKIVREAALGQQARLRASLLHAIDPAVENRKVGQVQE